MIAYALAILLLLPVEISATNDTDLEQMSQQVIEVEQSTRAWRQKRTGAGL